MVCRIAVCRTLAVLGLVGLSLGALPGCATEASDEVAQPATTSPINLPREAGLHAQLSPQVGGGHFVDGESPGEVAYVSVEPLFDAEDFEASGVRENEAGFVVELELSEEARSQFAAQARWGEPEFSRALASVYALTLVCDGRRIRSFSVEEVLEAAPLEVAVLGSRSEAEHLRRLLVEGEDGREDSLP